MNRCHTHIINSLFILLATAFVIHFAYPLYFTFKSIEIKEYQHRLISETNEGLETHKFSLSYFEQIKTGDELQVNGEMYDIVSVCYENDSAICTVLRDVKETKLNRSFAKHINNTTKREENCKQIIFWGPVSYTTSTYLHVTVFYPTKITYGITSSQFILNGHTPNIVQPPETV